MDYAALDAQLQEDAEQQAQINGLEIIGQSIPTLDSHGNWHERPLPLSMLPPIPVSENNDATDVNEEEGQIEERQHAASPTNSVNSDEFYDVEEDEINEEENKMCSICRTDKTDLELIKTPCNHVYCQECFFEWFKRSETCAVCRNKLTSWTFITDDSLYDELSELQIQYLDTVRNIKHCNKTIKRKDKVIDKLNVEINFLKKEQIRQRNRIDYAKGYHAAIDGKILKESELCVDGPYKKGFLKGFYDKHKIKAKDFLEDYDRLTMPKKEMVKKKIKILKRDKNKRQSTLFDMGVSRSIEETEDYYEEDYEEGQSPFTNPPMFDNNQNANVNATNQSNNTTPFIFRGTSQ
jgi:hypothetical protein